MKKALVVSIVSILTIIIGITTYFAVNLHITTEVAVVKPTSPEERHQRKQALVNLCLTRLTACSQEFLDDPRPDKASIIKEFNDAAADILTQYQTHGLTYAEVTSKVDSTFTQLMAKHKLTSNETISYLENPLRKEKALVEFDILAGVGFYEKVYQEIGKSVLSALEVEALLKVAREDAAAARKAFYEQGLSLLEVNQIVLNASKKHQENFSRILKLLDSLPKKQN